MSEKIDKAVLNENLIELQQGDEHAFDRVYEMTSKSVYILCFSVLKDSYKAEDIMQNTFIKVRTNVSQYEPNTNPLAWILTIAKSLAIN
ncbi:MAG: RNA polymerase sigma factor, partial [Clostridia bacterium]|nr:RNA polymerase sigma factor [Clostridia bacterium]